MERELKDWRRVTNPNRYPNPNPPLTLTLTLSLSPTLTLTLKETIMDTLVTGKSSTPKACRARVRVRVRVRVRGNSLSSLKGSLQGDP